MSGFCLACHYNTGHTCGRVEPVELTADDRNDLRRLRDELREPSTAWLTSRQDWLDYLTRCTAVLDRLVGGKP